MIRIVTVKILSRNSFLIIAFYFKLSNIAYRKAIMKNDLKKVSVALIGSEGGYGKWFYKFFAHNNCSLYLVDKHVSKEVAEQIVRKADVVLFLVPTLQAPEIILSYIHCSNERQFWMDITSLKFYTMAAMAKSKAEYVGLHPMTAPPVIPTLKYQVLTICEGRLDSWREWFKTFVAILEAKVEYMTPEEHDFISAIRQGLPHTLTIIGAQVCEEMGVDIETTFTKTTPFHRHHIISSCRMHSQPAQVYSGILIGNKYMREVLLRIRDSANENLRIHDQNDYEGYERKFNERIRHIGIRMIELGNRAFNASMEAVNNFIKRK